MIDLHHEYKMLLETAEICPEPQCAKIIQKWADDLKTQGYDKQPLTDIV
jgi:hypothetical protein